MIIPNNPALKQMLIDGGRTELAAMSEFEVNDAMWTRMFHEVRVQHPKLCITDTEDRASFRCLTLNSPVAPKCITPVPAQPDASPELALLALHYEENLMETRAIRRLIRIGLSGIAALLAGLLLAVSAHAQQNPNVSSVVTTCATPVQTIPAAGSRSFVTIDTSGRLCIAGSLSGGGDGAIQDGVSSSIEATVLDLMNANPLTVAIVDTDGTQISSFGGGVQYTEGDTDASITGTALLFEGAANTLIAAPGTTANGLLVDVSRVTGTVTVDGSGVTQPVSGTITANLSATDNAVLDDIADGIAVTNAGTFAVQAAQSGTWTVQPGNTANTTPWLISLSEGGVTADILDLTTANPLTVAIVDTNGDQISSFGGGVQYTQADTDTTITGTAIMFESDTGTSALDVVSASAPLPMTCISGCGGSGGTSQTDNTALADVTGIGALYDTTPPTITDGNVGAPRMDSSRYLYTVFPSAQAISGTVTANLSATDNAVLDDIADGITVDTELAAAAALADDTANPTIPGVGAFLMCFDGTTWDRCRSSSAGAGAVDSDTTRTVEGSDSPVTVSLQLIDDTIFTDDTSTHTTAVTKLIGIGAVATPTDTAVAANEIGMLSMTLARELAVSLTTALPAGTNNIGDIDVLSIAAGDNNIGNVDVVTMPTVTVTATNLDVQIGGSDTVTVTATNLDVQSGGADLATEATLASLLTSSQLIDDVIYVDDTATHTAATTKVAGIGAVAAPTDTTVNANDIAMPGMTTARELWVSLTTALPAGTNNIGDVDVLSIAAGTNYIGRVRLTDGTDDGDILDLTNSNPVVMAIVDGNGDQITSFGGGTQYTEDAAAAANPVGTALNLVRADTPAGITTTDGDNLAARGSDFGALYVTLLDDNGAFVAVGGGTQYDEDTATVAAEKVTMAGVVRQDTLTSLVGADQDRTVLSVNSSGALYSTVVNLADDAAEDAAVATDPVPIGGVYRTASVTLDNGDVGYPRIDVDANLQVVGTGTAGSAAGGVLTIQGVASMTAVQVADNSGSLTVDAPVGTPVFTTPTPSATGGWTPFNATAADGATACTNSAQAVKASQGTFGGYFINNPNTSDSWLHVYNTASGSVTVGTTNPTLSFRIPGAAANSAAANMEITLGVQFGTAITIACTSTAGGNGAPTAALEANIFYK